MANAGFQVINDDNILLINDTYMNFALTRKVQVSALPYWFANIKSGYMVEGSKFSCRKITLQSNERLAFLGGINGNGTLDGFISKDYNAAYSGKNAYYVLLRNGVNASSLYVYVFGEYNSVGDGSRYGLQVFDQSGKLVFSSNKKLLKILHYGSSNDRYAPSASKKVAINIGNLYYKLPYTELGDPYTPLYVNGKFAGDESIADDLMPYMSRYYDSTAPAIINGVVQVRSFDNEHSTYGLGNDPWSTWNGFVYTVIDVTNY